jgi:hypothetical protein
MQNIGFSLSRNEEFDPFDPETRHVLVSIQSPTGGRVEL